MRIKADISTKYSAVLLEEGLLGTVGVKGQQTIQ